jgi:hypothetical protein
MERHTWRDGRQTWGDGKTDMERWKDRYGEMERQIWRDGKTDMERWTDKETKIARVEESWREKEEEKFLRVLRIDKKANGHRDKQRSSLEAEDCETKR